MRIFSRGALLVLVSIPALMCRPAFAQEWPTKTVQFIAAAGPGSGPDIQARHLAEQLSRMWGQQVIIDNRPGAAGTIGVIAAVRAPADNHVFLVTPAAPLVVAPHTMKALSFDVEKDLVAVVGLGYEWMMIAVNPEVKAGSVAELVALAKASPGNLFLATSGRGNVPHLTGELLNQAAGIRLTHVPYKTTDQAAVDTVGGRTQVWIAGVLAVLPHMKAGRVSGIAVAAPRRLPSLPDLPTVAETFADFSVGGWAAIMAPRGTSAAVIAKVNRDVNTVFNTPEMKRRFEEQGTQSPGGTPEELAAAIRRDIKNYALAVKGAGIKPE